MLQQEEAKYKMLIFFLETTNKKIKEQKKNSMKALYINWKIFPLNIQKILELKEAKHHLSHKPVL